MTLILARSFHDDGFSKIQVTRRTGRRFQQCKAPNAFFLDQTSTATSNSASFHRVRDRIKSLLKTSIMSDQPIKRGRGASRLDEADEDQSFGQSRLGRRPATYRRSTRDASYASSLTADRGIALDCEFEEHMSYIQTLICVFSDYYHRAWTLWQCPPSSPRPNDY
jgi:hypothetical protein